MTPNLPHGVESEPGAAAVRMQILRRMGSFDLGRY